MDIALLHIDPLYVLSGALVGALVGFTGVGGGSLMTPLLILLFGVHPSTAVGTDLLYASATKTAGSTVHGRQRTIDWKVLGLLACGSIPAAALTVVLLYHFGVDSKPVQHVMTRVLGVALLFTAASLVGRKQLARFYADKIGQLGTGTTAALTVFTGLAVGTLVTLSSVGAGAIGVTALVLLYPKMSAQKIVGTDIAHAVPLTLLAGIGHSILGTIDMTILVSLLCGSVPAIVLASLAAVKVPESAVRIALAVVLCLVCARFWFMA